MQLVLQLTARVKDSQKAFEGLAMHQKQRPWSRDCLQFSNTFVE